MSTRWKQELESAKGDKFSYVIDGKILFRRVPMNYMVLSKSESTPCYYTRLSNALKRIVELSLIEDMVYSTGFEELLVELEKVYKNIEELAGEYKTTSDNMGK